MNHGGDRYIEINGTNRPDRLTGTSANDHIIGFRGDDTLLGGGGGDLLIGGMGEDYLRVLGVEGEAGLYGQDGDDVMIARVEGYGQVHMGGSVGDDRLIMDLTNEVGWQGHHAYGGRGADRFEFRNLDRIETAVLGRIDDFDVSRDSIHVDGRALDLNDLPNGIRVVAFNGQQWLNIHDRALYALEGARDGGDERHFTQIPKDLSQLREVKFIDQQNYVPAPLVDESALNSIVRGEDSLVQGTSGADWIHDTVIDHRNADGKLTSNANARIEAKGGDDVIDAGKGQDTVYGGWGDDSIAGGVDEDWLRGQRGDDWIFGGSENDKAWGGTGVDRIWAGTGNDSLAGNGGNDRLFGETGHDVISGHSGHDRIYGGAGNDRIFAGYGHDRVFGGNNQDKIWGGFGHDRLAGGLGDDRLSGGWGADTLIGGKGGDVLFGGGGADHFIFREGDLRDWGDLKGSAQKRNAALDRIADFTLGEDKIVFASSLGVDDCSDLMVWKSLVGGNLHYTIAVGHGDRLLVDVADDATWGAVCDPDNFIFG